MIIGNLILYSAFILRGNGKKSKPTKIFRQKNITLAGVESGYIYIYIERERERERKKERERERKREKREKERERSFI